MYIYVCVRVCVCVCVLFLVGHRFQMDIFRYYLLPKSTALKLCNQKYSYAAVQIDFFPHNKILLVNHSS